MYNKHFSTCCRFWTWNTMYTAFSIEIRSPSHIDQNYPLIKDDTKQHGRKKWSIWQVFFHPCESLLLNAAPKSATCEKNFNSRLMIKLLLEKLILHSLWVVFHFLQEDLAQKLVIGWKYFLGGIFANELQSPFNVENRKFHDLAHKSFLRPIYSCTKKEMMKNRFYRRLKINHWEADCLILHLLRKTDSDLV